MHWKLRGLQPQLYFLVGKILFTIVSFFEDRRVREHQIEPERGTRTFLRGVYRWKVFHSEGLSDQPFLSKKTQNEVGLNTQTFCEECA